MARAGTALTIGNFDGVHAGHAALVARARAAAGAVGGAAAVGGGEREADGGGGVEVVALAFDPHPLTRLRPEAAPARLTGFARRSELLREAGADRVVRLEPSDELLGLTPEAFCEALVRDYGPVAVVEGRDFRFGRGRTGGIDTLQELGSRLGFAVHVVEPVEVSLDDHTLVPASSSLVRWLLEQGRVGDAARVLTRPHELSGRIVPGDRRGRELGFPTANFDPEELVPRDGVYAGVARLEDGRSFPAAVSIGTKPTFGDGPRTVEAHLLGAPREGHCIGGLDEYGWSVRIGLVGWVRDQIRFESRQELIDQMARDCARAEQTVSGRAPALTEVCT